VLVSVIIPTFNRAAFVHEAVASVLAQRGASYELIVVDDGSTDGSADSLRQTYGDALRVVRTANHGVAAARNRGIAESRGEVVAFLDSDDLWEPDKLKMQAERLSTDPSLEICQVNEIWIRNGVRVNPPAHYRKAGGWIFEASLRHCLISPSAVLLRRRLLQRVGGFDESLPVCEDYDLWLRIARDTQVELIDLPLVIRRGGHADQLSHSRWGMDRFRVIALRKLLADGDLTTPQRRAAVAVLREKCRILAVGAAKRGRREDADHYTALAQDAA